MGLKFDEVDDNLRKPMERVEFGDLSLSCCVHLLLLGVSYNNRKGAIGSLWYSLRCDWLKNHQCTVVFKLVIWWVDVLGESQTARATLTLF